MYVELKFQGASQYNIPLHLSHTFADCVFVEWTVLIYSIPHENDIILWAFCSHMSVLCFCYHLK